MHIHTHTYIYIYIYIYIIYIYIYIYICICIYIYIYICICICKLYIHISIVENSLLYLGDLSCVHEPEPSRRWAGDASKCLDVQGLDPSDGNERYKLLEST